MKTKNVTFSIPLDLIDTLQRTVGRREMSKFVAKAVEKALKEKLKKLAAEYAASENDPDVQEVIEDWKALDVEGWE